MKSFAHLFLLTSLIAGSVVGSASVMPQGTPPSADSDNTAPSYDMKAQAILDLQQMQQKFASLAKAIPQEKYTWRPGEGARTFAELFLHVSAAGFNFPTLKGTP